MVITPIEGFSDRASSDIKDNMAYSRDKDIKVLSNMLLDAAISSTNLDVIVLVNKKGKSKRCKP